MNIFETGGEFEFNWMWYIQSQGYFVRQAIPVMSEAMVEDATDIDVWGIRFVPPMTHSVAVADCKYKRKPKTYERILWTKGMATYVGADHSFVGSPNANWKTIEFGRRGGITIIPYDTLKLHLGSLPVDRRPYAQARRDLYGEFFAKRKAMLKNDREIGQNLFDARNAYTLGSPITNINRLIAGFQKSMRSYSHADGQSERQILWLFVCCEYITAFAINLLKAAEESFFLPEPDRRGKVLKQLTYGDLPPRKAEEIMELSTSLAIAYAQEALPLGDRGKVSEPPPELRRLHPPDYAGEVVGLLDRMVRTPLLYWDAARLLDALLFESVIYKRNISNTDPPRLEGWSDPSEAVKAAKNYIAVICDAAQVQRRPFWIDALAPDQTERRPVNQANVEADPSQRVSETPPPQGG
jgi:hypothetical protein